MRPQQDASSAVAIVGMACRFPGADDLGTFWRNLRAARSSFGPIPQTRWDHGLFHSEIPREPDATYVSRGAFLDDISRFAALHFAIAPRRVAVMDPQQRLLLDTARVALQDSGLEEADFDRSRCATFVGVSTSEYRNILTARTTAVQMAAGAYGDPPSADGGRAIGEAVKHIEPISAFSIPGTLLNMNAANLADHWRLGGPAFAIDAACASSLVAVCDAVLYLRAGICDTAIAGGVYLNLGPESLIGFSRAGVMSKTGRCRPFDSEADGFLLGEGAGIVILKRLDDAIGDGDRIYAVIRGFGLNNNGTGEGPMAPSLSGQQDCLHRAFCDAAVNPSSVELVECHGTATPVGDRIEIDALHGVFSAEAAPAAPVWLGSVKANIGHTMSAAGVAGLIRAALAVHHETIPPQAGFARPCAPLDDDTILSVPEEAVPWPRRSDRPRHAGISSFGFGGTNCHVLIEEAPAAGRARRAVLEVGAAGAGRRETIVLGCATRELLAGHARDVAEALDSRENERTPLADVAYTLNATRRHPATRLAVTASSRQQLASRLRRAAALIDSGGELPLQPQPWLVLGPDGPGPWPPKIAFLFPGQGALRTGALRPFFDRFAVFRHRLLELEEAVADLLEKPLLGSLYPQSDGGTTASPAEPLTATEICQPVMVALGIALSDLLHSLGIAPAVCLGHSLGELTAAAVGGVLSGEDAVRLAARRGRLMADLVTGDRGAMAAVRGAPHDLKDMLGPDLTIANLNHRRQTVISGGTSAVEKALAALAERRVPARRLPVSHGFHSPAIRPAAEAVAALVDELHLAPPSTTVVSTTTGQPYPGGEGSPARIRELLRGHATSPVNFVAAVECCIDLEVDVFLELGAGSTLSGFVAAEGRGRKVALPLAQSDADRTSELEQALATLAVLGHPVHFTNLYTGEERRPVTLPATPLPTEPYWAVRPGTGEQTAVRSFAPDRCTAAPVEFAAQVSENEAPTTETGAGHRPEQALIDVVIRAVARVSDFPVEALEPHHSLSSDVGLDSLMIAELNRELAEALPGHRVLPASLLDAQTTIADLAQHVEQLLAREPDAHDSQRGMDLRLERYLPVLIPQPRSGEDNGWMREPTSILVTGGGHPLAAAVARRLSKAGHRVVLAERRCRSDSETSADDGVQHCALPDEPERIGRLFADLEARGLRPTAVIHLADLHLALPLGELVASDHDEWPNAVPLALALARALYHSSGEAPDAMVIVTGMGGTLAHSESPAGSATVWQAGLVGCAKALAREWPQSVVKAIDVDPSADLRQLSENVCEEIETSDRDPEVAFVAGQRHIVGLERTAFGELASSGIDSASVVLVTGGGRGLGAKVARELTSSTGCAVILTGRSRPAESSELQAHLDALNQAGARYRYLQWDVREAMPDTALAEARAALGQITAIVHCAGLLRDAEVSHKRPEHVQAVMQVKVSGLINCLRATAGDPVELVAVFSSWAGRFGNAGQTDYSAANELVSRLSSILPTVRAGRRSVSMSWPPWASSSMVGSIPAAVRAAMHSEGVPFISDDSGLEALRRELASEGSGEVVLGVDLPQVARETRTTTRISPSSHPFLDDHRIAKRAVLPMASILDTLGSVVRQHIGPDTPLRIDDLTLHSAILVDDPVELEIRLRERRPQGPGAPELHLELSSDGTPAAHATATAADAAAIADAGLQPVTSRGGDNDRGVVSLDELYADVLFHGPRLRGVSHIDELSESRIVGRVQSSRPSAWIAEPHRQSWCIDPLVVDSSLQLVAAWLWARHHRVGLPQGFASFVLLRAFADGPIRCTAVIDEMRDDEARGTINYDDGEGRRCAVMSGVRARLFDSFQDIKWGDSEPRPAASASPEIDESLYRIERFAEVVELAERFDSARRLGLHDPFFPVHEGVASDTSVVNDRRMVNFSSYNYLGLSGHPRVSAAAKAAVDRYGTSVSASRIASGEKPIHGELEHAIADLMGCEAAVVFTAGHMTNVSVIGHLLGEGDLILHDALAHNSILEGATLSGARRRPFPHNDWQSLHEVLEQTRSRFNRVLIAIEGVYSMDGDIPDLPRFLEVRDRHRCLLLVDEAHSIGVIGDTGRGVGELFGVDGSSVDLWMGTLSKSLASCGGYIAGSAALVDYLKYTAPAFVFSAGISPANAAAALAAIQELRDHPELVARLRDNSRLFLEQARAAGLDTGLSQGSAVVPCIVGSSMRCMKLAERLSERGVNVQPVVHPAVDEEAARLRFFISTTHSEEQIRSTVHALAEELRLLD